MNAVQTFKRVMKNFFRENLIFPVWFVIFSGQFISIVKRKANSSILAPKSKGYKKRDQFQVSKVVFDIQV